MNFRFLNQIAEKLKLMANSNQNKTIEFETI